MKELHPGLGGEPLAGDVVGRGKAGRRPGNRARLPFRQLDQLLHRAEGRLGTRDQHHRVARHERDRGEAAHRVVRQLCEQRRVDRERVERHQQQRVAVGRGLGDELGADHLARADAVLHHHRLLPCRGQLLAHHARRDVDRPARRRPHDHAHAFSGVFLSMDRECDPQEEQKEK